MQRYQSHKQVHAEPMTLGAYNEYRGWTIPEEEESGTPGYLVVYNKDTEDHYESWSPEHIFDDGYTPISDSPGFCRLFHSEEYGQILFSLQTDPDSLDPTIELTVERPYMGLVMSSEDFADKDEISEVLAAVDKDRAVEVVKAVMAAADTNE